MIRKSNTGYSLLHCSGKDKGKVIKTFRTKAEALRMHRAIEASKNKKK